MRTADQELLRRWYERSDAEAFREITSRYAGLVYAAARRVLRNASDAEDVAQECFEALALRQDTAPAYLGAWLHAAATNRALNALDSTKRRRAREERAAAERPEVSRSEWDDIYEHVDGAIAALPHELRDAVVGHFLEGQSKAELARALGVSRPTVHYRIDKGLERVRRTLRERGIVASGGVLGAALSAQVSVAAPGALELSLGRIAVAGLPALTSQHPVSTISTIGGMMPQLKTILFASTLVGIAIYTGTTIHDGNTLRLPDSGRAQVIFVEESSAVENENAGPDDGRASNSPDTFPESQPAATAASTATSPSWPDAGHGALTIAGHVVDSAGNPIEGASVYLIGNSILPTVRTRAEGEFQIDGVGEGQYNCSVLHEAYSDKLIAGVEAGNVGMLIELDHLISISGRVIDSKSRRPVAEFLVSSRTGKVSSLDPRSSDNALHIDHASGAFTLETVETGESTIVVQSPGYTTAFTALRVSDTEPVDGLEIALEPGHVVAGRVLDSGGAPVPGALVFPQSLESHTRIRQVMLDSDDGELARRAQLMGAAITDKDGAYSIDTLNGMESEMTAYHPDEGRGTAQIHWSGRSQLGGVNVVLDPPRASARVTVTASGEPKSGVIVSATLPGGRGESFESSTTSRSGSVVLENLPAGPVGILAIEPGGGESTRRIVTDTTLSEFETASVVVDFGDTTNTLEGRLHLDGQSPTSFTTILFVMTSTGFEQYYSRGNNADGRFRFKHVQGESAYLEVVAMFGESKRHKSLPISISGRTGTEIDIDLSGGGTVEGQVLGVPPNRHASVRVLRGTHAISEISIEAMTSLEFLMEGHGNVAADGTYTVEGLKPETYTLLCVVHGGNYRDARHATSVIQVDEGQPTIADFDMRE